MLTAAAGFLFGSKGGVDLSLFLALLAGTAFVIASACVFNNYIDRGLDAKMERTKKRALVSGQISPAHAITYGSILGLAGVLVLLQTNWLTLCIGAFAFFSYVVLYGIAKRKSVHGTLVGTLPGSASLVAGYTAASNQLDLAAAMLFLIMVTWQMPHFYSIAMFRLKDYKAAGLPVWPVKKGMKSTKLQIMLYIFIFIFASISLSIYGHAGLVYLVVMGGVGLYWLWKGINGFNATDDTKWARGMFGFSLIVLLTLSVTLSVGSILP